MCLRQIRSILYLLSHSCYFALSLYLFRSLFNLLIYLQSICDLTLIIANIKPIRYKNNKTNFDFLEPILASYALDVDCVGWQCCWFRSEIGL